MEETAKIARVMQGLVDRDSNERHCYSDNIAEMLWCCL